MPCVRLMKSGIFDGGFVMVSSETRPPRKYWKWIVSSMILIKTVPPGWVGNASVEMPTVSDVSVGTPIGGELYRDYAGLQTFLRHLYQVTTNMSH